MTASRPPGADSAIGRRSVDSGVATGRRVGKRRDLVRRQAARRPYLVLLPLLPLLLAVPLAGPSIDPNIWGDEQGYLGLAHHLVHGEYLTGRDDLVIGWPRVPNLWFGPGLPIVLTPFVALHFPVMVIRLLGSLFVFAAALLLFRLLRQYASTQAALAGSLAFGLYVPFYTVLVHLHSETLALLLVVTMMYSTSKYLRGGRRGHLVLAGVALGWLALTRVAFGWVITALLVLSLVWWALERNAAPRRFTAVCCLGLVCCAPWLVYTYSVAHRPFYWGSSGGLSLYWISSPYAGDRGDWQLPSDVFVNPRLAPHRAFFASLIGESIPEQNDRLLHTALSNIRAHPAKYTENVLANVSRMWFHSPYSFREERLKQLLYVVPNAFMLSALVVSLVLLLRCRPPLPVEAIPFGLFALLTFTFHALLAAYPRMLFPVVPVIIWFVVLVMSRCVVIARRTSST